VAAARAMLNLIAGLVAEHIGRDEAAAFAAE
jgi:hypothetical protein